MSWRSYFCCSANPFFWKKVSELQQGNASKQRIMDSSIPVLVHVQIQPYFPYSVLLNLVTNQSWLSSAGTQADNTQVLVTWGYCLVWHATVIDYCAIYVREKGKLAFSSSNFALDTFWSLRDCPRCKRVRMLFIISWYF